MRRWNRSPSLAAGCAAAALLAAACSSAGDEARHEVVPARDVACGIDVLVEEDFERLAGKRVGLVTNHTGRLRDGSRTIDALAGTERLELVALFSPEHGAEGVLDEEGLADGRDAATGLPVFSLYGDTKEPTPEMLAGLDALLFDVQDVGTRFYTYVSTMGLAMEAAGRAGVAFVVLDRPNPLGGDVVEGPVLDEGRRSFVGFHEIPVRHGMTVGELARLFRAERELDVELEVVQVRGWRRADAFDATGLAWTPTSPNMRRLSAAFLYPGVGLLEFTNVSVGRGTDTPFERVGAPWIDGRRLADALAAARVEGLACVPVTFVPTSSVFAGETCGGVDLFVTERGAFRSVRAGLALAQALRDGFGEAWDRSRFDRLLGDDALLAAFERGASLDALVEPRGCGGATSNAVARPTCSTSDRAGNRARARAAIIPRPRGAAVPTTEPAARARPNDPNRSTCSSARKPSPASPSSSRSPRSRAVPRSERRRAVTS
ncbi:MAG: DUF1343 domain-containing protein [Planctomycetota bacterium]